jgi:hypothetical protein
VTSFPRAGDEREAGSAFFASDDVVLVPPQD